MAFDGWYSQQLPLPAMAAISVEAVLAPDADTGLPPVAFQPVVTAPNPYGGPQYRYDGGGVERVRGAVVSDTYQPMLPVATAVVVPLGDASGGGGGSS